MPRAVRWRHEALDLIGEREQRGAVVLMHGGKREQRGHLGGCRDAAGRSPRNELRRGDIYRTHDRQLAFFDILLHPGGAHARGDVPVDQPHVVAYGVLAGLSELDACAAKHAAVVARK
jgi:hypothetical protein